MRREKWNILFLALLMSISLCACGEQESDVQGEKNDTEISENTKDGKLFVTDDMKQELEEFFGMNDSSDKTSKAEARALANAKQYAASAAIEVTFSECEIAGYELIDDYACQAQGKVYGKDNAGEEVEVEFTTMYYFEKSNKKAGYQLVEEYTELSDKIWAIKGY